MAVRFSEAKSGPKRLGESGGNSGRRLIPAPIENDYALRLSATHWNDGYIIIGSVARRKEQKNQ